MNHRPEATLAEITHAATFGFGMLSATIIQLARLEGMIDDENRILKHSPPKS
ncbi:MAG TPA: hypothetical protein PLH57_08165 [Oligoflexia bacterium]|nr:hypothetical protein [Oligoflexia bacterium]